MHADQFVRLAIVLLGAAAAAVACRQPEPQIAAANAHPAVHTPVGPVPGPGEASPRQSNPLQDLDRARVEGRRHFTRFNCAGCHGLHAGGGMGPSLRDAAWLYGRSDAQIFSSVVYGRAHGMPSWGRLLTTQQVWELVAYIDSLRTADEPEPPR